MDMKLSRVLVQAKPGAWRFNTFAVATILVGIATSALAGGNGPSSSHRKLDQELTFRADHRSASELTTVIVTVNPSASLPNAFKRYLDADGTLDLINGHVLTLPNGALKQFEVTVEPKSGKISPVVTARLRLNDGQTELTEIPVATAREGSKVTCWFRVAPKFLAKSRLEFGEHGYGPSVDGQKNPVRDEWGSPIYIGLPGGTGYWFILGDFTGGNPG